MTESAHTTTDIHLESVFEEHIVQSLVSQQGYIERTCASDYEVGLAIDKELLIQFLKTTQPDAWQSLEDHYSGSAENELFKRLEQALKSAPTHKVRNCVRIAGSLSLRSLSACHDRSSCGNDLGY